MRNVDEAKEDIKALNCGIGSHCPVDSIVSIGPRDFSRQQGSQLGSGGISQVAFQVLSAHDLTERENSQSFFYVPLRLEPHFASFISLRFL